MSWTDCVDEGCRIQMSEKQGSGLYPQFTRRSRQLSVAHDHDWQQEMEGNPGEDSAPQQQTRQPRARKAHVELTGGSIVLTTIAKNTAGKGWTPNTTPDKWDKKGPCQKTTEGSNERDEP